MQVTPPPAVVQTALDPRFQDKAPQATGNNHSVTESETRKAVAPTPENTAGAAARDAASQKNQSSNAHDATENKENNLHEMLKKLNQAVGLFDAELQFTADDHNEDVRVVKVINKDTKEVIRQIPSEEAVRIAKAIDSFRGLLIRDEA